MITDAQIIEAARAAKRRHYASRSLDELLIDPVEMVHLCLDTACAVDAIDHMASARVREAMEKSIAKEKDAADLVRRIAKVIALAHEHGELGLY